MGAVFISYRREDTEWLARALCNALEQHVGRDAVFIDVDSIDLGRDFRDVLQERLQSCDQMLALIGPHWLDAKDAAGKRRLDQASDFVRQEISAALKRKIPVTPILVQGVQLPELEQLPEDLRDLRFRNGFELSHTKWQSDVEDLVGRLGLRKARVPADSPGVAPVAAGADAKAAVSTAAGVSLFERATGFARSPWRWFRSLRWWMQLALILLALILWWAVAAMNREEPEESGRREPAAGSAALADATNPPLSPQAGPEATRATAGARTIVGLIGDAKFNMLSGTPVSDG